MKWDKLRMYLSDWSIVDVTLDEMYDFKVWSILLY